MNKQRLTPGDLAEKFGYISLANELQLRRNSSTLIQLEKAKVVRLVIKKRNVQRCDTSNQVNEEDLLNHTNSNESIQPFQQQIQ